MSRHKKNGKPRKKTKIHGDSLKPSDQHTCVLGEMIGNKFEEVIDEYMHKWQIAIQIPDEIKKAAVLWRTMVVRHRNNDQRHTDSEYKAMRVVAQWTLDMHMDFRGQPRKELEWREE